MSNPRTAHINASVPVETWNRAQVWERDFWLRQQRNLKKLGKNHIWKLLALLGKVEKYRGDDSNRWWAKQFDSYSFLPPFADNVIEVGCGPYTNIRLIQKVCRPKHLFLSDPLIRTYLTNEEDFGTHPDGMRTGHPITLDAGWFEPYIAKFQPIIKKVLSREDGRTPQWHHATLLFAGKMR